MTICRKWPWPAGERAPAETKKARTYVRAFDQIRSQSGPSSIAPARIGRHILPVGITVVAIALGHPVARPGSCGRAGNRPGCAADDGAGRSTTRLPGQQTTKQATHDRATDGAGARIRRRGWRRIGTGWRWRIGRGRRGIDDIVSVVVGDVVRRPIDPLRIPVPDAADIPPPAIPAVVNLVPPTAAFPGDMAAIGMAGEIVRRRRAAPRHVRMANRPTRSHWAGGCTRRDRLGRLDRWLAGTRRRPLM